MTPLNEIRQDTLARVKKLAPLEGYNLTPLADVRVLRSDRPLTDTPVLYDPGIVVVCQGCKRGYFGQETYVYDAQHYLAVAVPVPFTMQSDGSAKKPLLALYLHLDLAVVAELLIELDRTNASTTSPAPRSMVSSPMDADMKRTVNRLLRVMGSPLEAGILGRGAVRELYFRVLTGPQGQTLRAALNQKGQFGRIGQALRVIHADYASPLMLADLAQAAGMSEPSFYSHFRAVTRTSPMQYLKTTRLHQARLLMVRQEMTAAASCHAVGYESTSQFSREFKRLFGLAPAAEVRRMKAAFAVPPAQEDALYVSSH